jgi:hypothetical protein
VSELPALIRISRSKPVRRELCCPECGDCVTLKFGRLYCCAMDCSWGGVLLAELAVRK